MGTPFRALRTENKMLRGGILTAAVEARRAANRRAFWKLMFLACGIGMILGSAMTVTLMAVAK
jgi:hypothetical protein